MKHLYIILISLILFIGGFLRLYRISEYMTYLGDEGRDMLVVKRMIVDHKFTLLGPITSVGSIYMGPIYYYFMVPFLWAWSMNPVGPSVMVVLFALVTILLIFKLSAKFFDPTIGLIASFLYAISPLPILFGRSSWNPNIVPFFSLLAVYALIQITIKKTHFWFLLLGMTLGILFQLHYVTFMFVPITLSVLALHKFRYGIKKYLSAFLGFIITYSPFLMFEFRHGFVNFQQAIRFMIQQKKESPISFYSVGNVIVDVFVRLFWRLVTIENAEITKIFIILLAVILVIYFRKYIKNTIQRTAFYVLLLWGFVGIFSYGLYRGVIYDYYFGSLFALPYILTGIFIFTLWKQNLIGKIFAALVLLLFSFFAANHSPLKVPPSNLLGNSKTIAQFVFEKTEKKPYNFALIAGRNSDHAYRYFLEAWGMAPVQIENPTIDPDRKTVTENLFIVCEEKECKPLGHPLWEIAGFGRAQIVGEWQVSTAKVFKLDHFKDKASYE